MHLPMKNNLRRTTEAFSEKISFNAGPVSKTGLAMIFEYEDLSQIICANCCVLQISAKGHSADAGIVVYSVLASMTFKRTM